MKSFSELSLDARLLRSIDKKGLTVPTAVQAEAIPKALEGKDIIARARTGSGKTLAYLLPALHALLGQAGPLERFQVVVLVPTSELVEQVSAPECTESVFDRLLIFRVMADGVEGAFWGLPNPLAFRFETQF
jgi:superfamily II DNA/RNA helicase